MIGRMSILLLILMLPMVTIAQTPLGINYQGIARSGDGSPLINQNIGLRVSITAGPDGSTDYIEDHHVATNDFGLFTVIVGNGQSSGSLNDVDWVAGNKWLQIEIDPQDQGNYMVVGSQQLLSVPYALYAAQSGSELSPGVGIDISNGKVNNALPDQIITLEGDGAATVTGTYPNFRINTTDNVEDADASATNEIQALTLNGTNLELTDGGIVDLSGFVNTDGQNLADVLSQGTDANGAIISGLLDPLLSQDAATKNYVDSQNALDLDQDSTNEIQDLQFAADTLTITNNGSATPVDLSGYLDNTDAQDLTDVLGNGASAGGTRITDVGNPTEPQDAATKVYVDGQATILSTDISTNSSAISTEATARTTADGALQNELDATQTGAGLDSNGTYTAPSTSNYLNRAVSLKDADDKLDAEISTNASSITTLTSRLDNTYAFSADFSTDATSATTKSTVTLIETLDNFNQVSSSEVQIGASGLYLIVIDAERIGTTDLISLYLSIIKPDNTSIDSNFGFFGNSLLTGKTIIRYLNSGDRVRILLTTADAITSPFIGTIGGYKISD